MIRRAAALRHADETDHMFDEDDAAMTEAGADIVVCHMGLTTGGSIGAETGLDLYDCVEHVSTLAAATHAPSATT